MVEGRAAVEGRAVVGGRAVVEGPNPARAPAVVVQGAGLVLLAANPTAPVVAPLARPVAAVASTALEERWSRAGG